MYKKFITLALALVLMLSLCACRGGISFNSSDYSWGYHSVPGTTENTFGDIGDDEETLNESQHSGGFNDAVPDEVIKNTESTNNNTVSTPSASDVSDKSEGSSNSSSSDKTNSSKDQVSTGADDETEDVESNDRVIVPSPDEVTYEEYHAMTPDDQQAFFASFETVEDFFDWYLNAKEVYEKEHPDIDIGDGTIDIGKITG